MRRNNHRTRDNTSISNHRLRSVSDSLYSQLSPLSRLREASTLRLRSLLSEISDRRTFHPLGAFRPALSYAGLRHRLVLSPSKMAHKALPRARSFPIHGRPAQIAFQNPSRTLICVRRKQRREVLHALKRTGSGGGFQRPRRSWYSSVRC